MTAVKAFTKEEIETQIDREHWTTVNRWLARGDGIAVYVDVDFGSSNIGHVKCVSYGSSAAQIEAADPPDRMPDIGGTINWKYRLQGIYKGDALGKVAPV